MNGARALVVDDAADIRLLADLVLSMAGFQVTAVGSGREALRVLSENDLPDIVLLDVQLPDFDGFEVADRLRRFERAPEVVLTSSRDSADFGSLIGSSAARGFVPKDELSGGALAALLAA